MVAAALAVLTAAVVAAGCERRSDSAAPPQGAPSARVVATDAYGAQVLLDERVAPGQSVMDALRGVTTVANEAQRVAAQRAAERAAAAAEIGALYSADRPYAIIAPWVRGAASRLPEGTVSLVGTGIVVGGVDE